MNRLSASYRRTHPSEYGSFKTDEIRKSTFDMVSAGDHWFLEKLAQQPNLPEEFMFGWKILVVKYISGALKG